MFRKFITGILIVTLLGQVGCMPFTEITLEEMVESEETGRIILSTKDELIYKFDEGNYVIKSDTLCGYGIEQNKKGAKQNYEGCITASEIHTVEARKVNTGLTVLGIFIFLFSPFAIWGLTTDFEFTL